MCLCSASRQCVCRVRALKQMQLSNSEFRGVEWEIATGNRGTWALFLGGWGRIKNLCPGALWKLLG